MGPRSDPACLGIRIRNTLVPLLGLVGASKAAPIKDSSASSSWLACLVVLLVFSVICLSTFKLFFVRYRRISNLRGPKPMAAGKSCIHRCFKPPRYPAPASCRNSNNCKLGFFIGLFGSPSFEIRSKPSEITLVYPGADTSKSSQNHEFSADTSASSKTKDSTYSTGPVVLFNEEPYSWKTRAIQSQKQDEYPALFVKSTKPRLSLPTQLSFDLGRIRRKKQHSPSGDMHDEDLPWPHNHLERATFRLVKLYSESEAPLPTDHNANRCVSHSPSTVDPKGLAVTRFNKSQATQSPQLPSIETSQEWDVEITPPQMGVLQKQADYLPTQAPHAVTKSRPGRQWVRRASLSPNLSVIDEHCSLSVPEPPYEYTVNYSLPGPPLCALGKQHLVSEASLASAKSPPIAYSLYDTLRRNQRVKSFPVRSKGGPPLGPSPLRLAILPETMERQTPESSWIGGEVLEILPDRYIAHTRGRHSRLGLGLAPIEPSSTPPRGFPRAEQPPKDILDGRKSVLDLLRELAEETKDWDESVVLNEGFRSMIQQSRAAFDGHFSEDVKHSIPKTSLYPTAGHI